MNVIESKTSPRQPSFSCRSSLRPCSGAFTLIELLAVIGIIGVLAALAVAGAGKVRDHARRTIEISAARNLISAYNTYSSDHGGLLMPGEADLYDLKNSPVYNLSGKKLSSPVNARYPWRLIPYLGGAVEGAILVNESIEESKEWAKTGSYDYNVSAYPSLGINATYVGTAAVARNSKGEVLGYNTHSVQRAAQVYNPGRLIVFASAAGYDGSGSMVHGYLEARGPYDADTGVYWPSQPADKDIYIMNTVHLRWGGRAVVANLDGNVQLLDEGQLRDMRRWSNQAAEANNPSWAGQ